MCRRILIVSSSLLLVLPALLFSIDLFDLLAAEIALEQRLLAADLSEHADLRLRQEREAAQVADLAARLDDELEAESPALETLERLDGDLAAARDAEARSAQRAEEVRRRAFERWRRIGLLRAERDRLRADFGQPRDALSGRWRVTVLPGGSAGVFDLRLDGTLVSGSYNLEGGAHGSLRGTLVGATLTLERVDAVRGFDVIYEAKLDRGRGELRGTWRSSLLATGGPSAGDWAASRIGSSEGGEE